MHTSSGSKTIVLTYILSLGIYSNLNLKATLK